MTENRETLVQKSLSEWWSEETEYVFQRIERWAAFARGYNRLRSRRWSKEGGRATQETPSIRKPTSVDETKSSRHHGVKYPRPRKSRSEEARINCCGGFSYQSNGQLDSNCLETYRYDHSIYFKTIGDIRSDRRVADGGDHDEDEETSISSEELVEWDADSFANLLADASTIEETRDECLLDILNFPVTVVQQQETTQVVRNAWPIVDLAKLDLNPTDVSSCVPRPVDKVEEDDEQLQNNNANSSQVEIADSRLRKEDRTNGSRSQERTKRLRSFRKSRRASRNVRRSSIVSENNVVWPGIFLNCTNVADKPSCDQ